MKFPPAVSATTPPSKHEAVQVRIKYADLEAYIYVRKSNDGVRNKKHDKLITLMCCKVLALKKQQTLPYYPSPRNSAVHTNK